MQKRRFFGAPARLTLDCRSYYTTRVVQAYIQYARLCNVYARCMNPLTHPRSHTQAQAQGVTVQRLRSLLEPAVQLDAGAHQVSSAFRVVASLLDAKVPVSDCITSLIDWPRSDAHWHG